MSILDRILTLYNKTANIPVYFRKIKIDSSLRMLYVLCANSWLWLKYKIIKPHTPRRISSNKVIVSLTSFPARINDVWKTIATIVNQSIPPQKIILWLSEDQFKDKNDLPKILLRFLSEGLEIRFVPNDIRSHKKYLYAFKEYPDSYVLLIDDDILYPSNMIEELLKDMDPNKVHCSYGSIITYGEDGKPINYKDWPSVLETYRGSEFFFGSGGGTLVMPSSLCEDTTNIRKALELCPMADDIWLNAMCRLSNLKIEKVRSGLIFPIKIREKITLHKINVGQELNDSQIANVIKEYPNIFRQWNR